MLHEEVISYPELGHIYPGDYYEAIPYDEYIDPNQPFPAGVPVFDIRSYGAKPGNALSTAPIRLACEACRDEGGGIVLVSGGSYRSGTIHLYAHTTLWIAPDSELRASRNADDLICRLEGTQDFGDESSGGAFILVVDAEDVAITGGGVIHGEGEWFVHEPKQKPALTPFPVTMLPTRAQAGEINSVPGSIRTFYRDRIRYAEDKYHEGKPVLRRPSAMVWFVRCRNVRVENVILRDSMCWTLHPESCDDILIRNVVIDDNRHVANSDGVDLSGCSDVEVDHCFISCADDGLCIKNPVYTHRVSENLFLHDCTVVTVMNAFKIGTGTRYDIRNVRVEDCHFLMPDIFPGSVSGISIESCDGSQVEHVSVRRIRMENIQCPLYLLLNRRNQAKEPDSEDPEAPCWGGGISDILIEQIHAEGAELPCILTGYTDRTKGGKPIRKALRDLRISAFDIRYRENEMILHLPETVDEFLMEYPECNAHGDVDACGLWIRHADHVQLEDIRIAPRSTDPREIIRLLDVKKY